MMGFNTKALNRRYRIGFITINGSNSSTRCCSSLSEFSRQNSSAPEESAILHNNRVLSHDTSIDSDDGKHENRFHEQKSYNRWTKGDSKELIDLEKTRRQLLDSNDDRWNQKSVELAKNSLITRRRIPPNFIKEIFIPHLERFIWESRIAPPWYILEIVIAYSQMPIINSSLSDLLADTVLLRIVDYVGPDFVKMLFPFYRMRPKDSNLFAHFSIELEEHFYELSTLHLIAIVRVYAKIDKNEQQIEFIEQMVIPRLQQDIAKYDTEELSALLVSLAAAPKMETSADVPLLAAIIPQIEKRFDETPILTTIVNLNALCRLRVYHKRLLDLASVDLGDRWRIRNIPPKYIAVAVWTFSRFNLLDRILPAFEELIANNLERFTSREFARFCQALPEESPVPLSLALCLLEELPQMRRNHFLFFFIGVLRRGFVPTQYGERPNVKVSNENKDGSEKRMEEDNEGQFYHLDSENLNEKTDQGKEFSDEKLDEDEWNKQSAFEDSIEEEGLNDVDRNDQKQHVPKETILHECLEYCNTFENDFEVDEIHRIIHLLRFHQQYSYITTMLPESWETIINEVMIMGK